MRKNGVIPEGRKKTMRRDPFLQEYKEFAVTKDENGEFQRGELLRKGNTASANTSKNENEKGVLTLTWKEWRNFRFKVTLSKVSKETRIKQTRKGPRVVVCYTKKEETIPNSQLQGKHTIRIVETMSNACRKGYLVRDGVVKACDKPCKLGGKHYNGAKRSARRSDISQGNFEVALGRSSGKMNRLFK